MKLVCILVTFNRITKLKKALEYYDNQTNCDFTLIVVDNQSTDGTNSYLESWKQIKKPYQKIVLTLDSNMGGSGGFYAGQQYAMKFEPDWIFVADDDAYPATDLFEKFMSYLSANNAHINFSAICAAVYKPNGKDIDIYHRSWFRSVYGYKFMIDDAPLEYYDRESFEIGSFSYVGTFLNSKIIIKAGCCNPDFFIFYDDSDHAQRMKKYGKIIVLPKLKIIHDAYGSNNMNNETYLTWRDYYRTRNQFYIQKKYFKTTLLYSAFRFVLSIIKHYWNNKQCFLLLIHALKDGICGNLGKHPIYCPPYKIQK